MKFFGLIILILVFTFSSVIADDFANLATKGNDAYREGDYRKALDYYHQAEVESPENPALDYNIGNALYKDDKYEEAVEKYKNSLSSEDVEKVADANYNLGNVQYRMADYQNAIMSYQNALELNPDDLDAKYNLELARKMLKEQMKPENQDQQQQQQQQQDKQKQEEQKDEEQQDEDQQQQQQQRPEDQEEEDQQEEQQQPQPQPEESEMTKEDAERILNALKDDERDIQKDQERFKVRGTYRGNDW